MYFFSWQNSVHRSELHWSLIFLLLQNLCKRLQFNWQTMSLVFELGLWSHSQVPNMHGFVLKEFWLVTQLHYFYVFHCRCFEVKNPLPLDLIVFPSLFFKWQVIQLLTYKTCYSMKIVHPVAKSWHSTC